MGIVRNSELHMSPSMGMFLLQMRHGAGPTSATRSKGLVTMVGVPSAMARYTPPV